LAVEMSPCLKALEMSPRPLGVLDESELSETIAMLFSDSLDQAGFAPRPWWP